MIIFKLTIFKLSYDTLKFILHNRTTYAHQDFMISIYDTMCCYSFCPISLCYFQFFMVGAISAASLFCLMYNSFEIFPQNMKQKMIKVVCKNLNKTDHPIMEDLSKTKNANVKQQKKQYLNYCHGYINHYLCLCHLC